MASACIGPEATAPLGDAAASPAEGVMDGGTAEGDATSGALMSPPPAAPGKPGLDITAGGNVSTRSHYRLFGMVGEAPGGNVVSSSKAYVLHGGVVATAE
jgi:hypothetical protein